MMSEVRWLRGTIEPPRSGEYYVISKALRDMADAATGEIYYKAGEYEITGDWWDADEKAWQSIGRENPYWEVEAWADILRPNVPKDIADKVRVYFGRRLKNG